MCVNLHRYSLVRFAYALSSPPPQTSIDICDTQHEAIVGREGCVSL
jgi:hypothetical protein